MILEKLKKLKKLKKKIKKDKNFLAFPTLLIERRTHVHTDGRTLPSRFIVHRKKNESGNENVGWKTEEKQKNELTKRKKGKKEQGRINGNPCRGRLGRGSNELGRGRNYLGRGLNIHKILVSELFYLQKAQKRKKS